MTEPKDYNIDEILNKYELTENGLPAIGDLRTTKERFEQELFELITKEIIGEDEETVQTKVEMYPPKIRNKLRQEQRQKLSDLFNIKEK